MKYTDSSQNNIYSSINDSLHVRHNATTSKLHLNALGVIDDVNAKNR